MIDKETKVLQKDVFEYFTNYELKRSIRYQSYFTLLCLEPDEMQNNGLNLKMFADVLRDDLRDTDIVGRLNGIRFGVILLNADLRSSHVAAERLLNKLENYLFTGKKKKTVAIGGACFPINANNFDDLMNEAESMLTRARENGGNTLCLPSKGDLI